MDSLKPVTYAFKDFVVNGLGADLIRIIELMYYCRKKGCELHLLGRSDNWLLAPEDANDGKCWLHYFSESIPIDHTESYTKIIEFDLQAKNQTQITESDPFAHFSSLLKQIYKPAAHMIAKTDNQLAKFSHLNRSNFVAVHIRRGDKTAGPWAEGKKLEVDSYLEAVQTAVDASPNKSDLKYLYVATDTNEVIVELQAKMLPNGMTLVFDDEEVRRDGYVYKLYQERINPNEKEEEIITFMKNMDLLVRANEIVGARMSFFFIVAELLRGRRGINLANNRLYPVAFY